MNPKKWYSLDDLIDGRWKKWNLSINDLLHYALDGEFELYKDPTSKPLSKNEITDLISYFNKNFQSCFRFKPPWTYLVTAKDVFEFEKNHGLKTTPKWLPGIWGEIQKEIAQLRNDPHAHTNYPGRFNRHLSRAKIEAAKKGIQKTKPEKQDEFEKEDGLDQSPKRKVFPCPPNTKWKEIKITLIADNKVRIEAPHDKGYYFFHELGMGYRGSGDRPIKLWNLLRLFANNHGEVSYEDIKEDKDRRSLFSSAKRLDKHMRNLFKIDESIYISSYSKEKKYNTKIFFSDQTKVVREAAEGETDDIQSVVESEIEDIKSRPLKDSRDNIYR